MEFKWLHLSDLHWNDDRLKTKWPQIRHEFYEDLERISQKVGAFDVVVFSGDLTQYGSKEEFDKVIEILDDLLKSSVPIMLNSCAYQVITIWSGFLKKI